MALTIDESWIRERVKLKHDHLDDVKSLALPGTYHEKISSLGASLRAFTRLKNLDLSRNAIQSLEGFEHLHLLETLNLYYNNISWLRNLSGLKHLTNLKELDLRLNPVTKNEVDYRLYIVHMLPNLKRLDDRSVRDSERRAAIMHFTTDQTTGFSEHPPLNPSIEHERISVPRADMVRNLGPVSALADDDVAVLDLISRTGGDLNQPRGITGSTARVPDLEDFTRDELYNMHSFATPSKYKPETIKMNQTDRSPPRPWQKDRVYVQFADDPKPDTDPTLKYTDESSAYTSYSTKGHFTPNPLIMDYASTSAAGITGSRSHDQALPSRRQPTVGWSKEPPQSHDYITPEKLQDHARKTEISYERNADPGDPLSSRSYEMLPAYSSKRRQTSPKQSQGPIADRIGQFADGDMYSRMSPTERISVESGQTETLSKLLDLVDRYWNGSKSLHRNSKFQSVAQKLISSQGGFTHPSDPPSRPGGGDKLRTELAERTAELSKLRDQMSEQQRELERVHGKMKGQEMIQGSLDVTTQELMAVKSRLQETLEENSALRMKVTSLEARNLSSTEQEKQLGEISRKNNDLEVKVKTFSQQVLQQNQNLEQLQELTTMLQESHRSLVATNDHLLRELDETRQRHNHEVQQLHWSYDKLKNTMDWLPIGAK